MTDGKDTIWRYGGRAIPFDVADTGCAGRLTEALSHIRDRTGGNSVPEVIEAHCEMIGTFFDTLFGPGMGELLCGTTRSAAAYSRAFLDFAAFLKKQTERLGEARREAEERYFRKKEAFPPFARRIPDPQLSTAQGSGEGAPDEPGDGEVLSVNRAGSPGDGEVLSVNRAESPGDGEGLPKKSGECSHGGEENAGKPVKREENIHRGEGTPFPAGKNAVSSGCGEEKTVKRESLLSFALQRTENAGAASVGKGPLS